MSKNNIEGLREHLFAELENLRDPEKKYDKDRTRAVVEIAQTIINSVKAETNFFNAVKPGHGSGFIPDKPRTPQPAAIGAGKKSEDDLPRDAGWMK